MEDSPLEAELARRALEGFDVETFADGPAMLERRSTHGGPTVLILDWQLPGMSGLEVCRFLRASVDEATLPILMLTVQGNKEDVVEALSAGANDYLTKPYDAAELQARVGNMCRGRRLYEDLQVERERLHRASVERERLLAYAQEGWSRAEQANSVKDDFLAVVSHELRTPLNAITGWITILQRGELSDDKRQHAIDTIERNARAQAQLIDDLLDVSRIIFGKLDLQVEMANLEKVTKVALESVELMARAKGVEVKIERAPGNYDVVGDPGRLQQIVWNLLNNAVKFTPTGGRVKLVLGTGARVSLSVSDTGRGIESSLLPVIFDRFKQAEGSPTRRHGGLGLGLAIVKHLVELHEGNVRAESPGLDSGATFYIDFPKARDSTASSPLRRDTPADPGAKLERELAGLRVLLVDDDEDGREMVEHVLVTAGATVSTAVSASHALQALDSAVPDVLISDVGMPSEDGLMLLRRVRARPIEAGGRIPAVALTAFARAEDRANALRAGFNAHVAKPVQVGELIAVIAALCGRFLGSSAAP